MRKFVAALVALIALSSPAVAAQRPAEVGQPAPAFSLNALRGGKISLAQFRGQPVFLNFFATWCPPCKLELSFIVARFHQSGRSVAFVGIDEQETPQAVASFVQTMRIAYNVTIDPGNVASAYLVAALPASIFIDKNGIVRAVHRGYLTPQLLEQDLTLISGH